MNPRYIITRPVPNGNAWWTVHDTRSKVMPNFIVADFFEDLPNAGTLAYDLCDRLNREETNVKEKATAAQA